MSILDAIKSHFFHLRIKIFGLFFDYGSIIWRENEKFEESFLSIEHWVFIRLESLERQASNDFLDFLRYSFRAIEFLIVCYLFLILVFFSKIVRLNQRLFRYSDRRNEDGKFNQPQNSFLSYRNSFWSACSNRESEGSPTTMRQDRAYSVQGYQASSNFACLPTSIPSRARKASRLRYLAGWNSRRGDHERVIHDEWSRANVTYCRRILPFDGPTEIQKPANPFHFR